MAKIVKRCDIAGFFGGEVEALPAPDCHPNRPPVIGFFGGEVDGTIATVCTSRPRLVGFFGGTLGDAVDGLPTPTPLTSLPLYLLDLGDGSYLDLGDGSSYLQLT